MSIRNELGPKTAMQEINYERLWSKQSKKTIQLKIEEKCLNKKQEKTHVFCQNSLHRHRQRTHLLKKTRIKDQLAGDTQLKIFDF